MSLGKYVRILGVGPGRSRSMTQIEAREAMTLILSGEADPHAVGALLMLLRLRGETAPEIAGFVEAFRAAIPQWQGTRPALDWPSYAAGRTRGVPWFLLSARLVAQAGFPVLLHGWNSNQNPTASVRSALPIVGIEEAKNIAAAEALLAKKGIAYLPLEAMLPRGLELLKLREVLNLRSAVNTVLRVLNPAQAPASLQGVFHPPYRDLQADAGALLGQTNLTVIKGGGGEFERLPTKPVALFGLRNGQPWQADAPALSTQTRKLNEDEHEPSALAALWDGTLEDPFAKAIVLGTAALALETTGQTDGYSMACDLWSDRLAENDMKQG